MDFLEIDKKWQEKWYNEGVFEPEHSEKEKFFFTIPYPYVSGALHVGHGRTYTNGDIVARFRRMLGFNVLWPMGFHITGTPVLAISSKIKAGDEKTIQMYKNYVGIYEKDEKRIDELVKSFVDPWNIVKYFSSKLIMDFKSMGFSLDLSRQFTTGDKEYNKFVEWQFLKFKENGYLKKGNYPILYCPKDENAVGEDDISGGDEEKIEVQKFVTLKFKSDEGYLVSATLRPDTFFGITNMFVNPEGIYVIADVEGEKLIISKDASEKLKLQGKKVKILGEKKGEEFVGKFIQSPAGGEIPILPGDFVDPEHGTGFVHSVPAHAPFDHVAIQDLKKNKKILAKYPGLEEIVNGIKYISVIDCEGFGEFPAVEVVEKGKVMNLKEKAKLNKVNVELYKKEHYGGKLKENCKEFAGISVEKAKEELGEWIVKKGFGFYFYETSSKEAKCRCGAKIVVAIMNDQWFLDFNAGNWKKESRKCLDEMIIYPDNYRKQFEDVFEWLDKRPCARKRGLGTYLPFDKNWIIESLSDSTLYMAFYTIIKKVRELGIKAEELTPEFFDYVFLGKGEGNENWNQIKKEFEYWYPNDLRHTAVAHITNHLSFMVFAHTGILPEKYWPKGFTLNGMLISEGRKMSKSKGNVVMLNHISKEYGADAFRLYISSTADFGSVLDYRKKDAMVAKRNLEKFFSFCEKLIQIKKSEQKGKESHLTKWMKSVFERAVEESTNSLERFEIRNYIQTSFYKLSNDIEYFMRKSGEEEKKEIADYLTLRWIKLLSPVIPHTCEELGEMLGEKELISLQKWPQAIIENINPEVENTENYLKQILGDVERIKKLVKIKANKVKIVVASKEKNEKLVQELKKNDPEKVEYFAVSINYLKKNFYKLKDIFSPLNEYEILEQGKEFISKEIGLEMIVEKEEQSENEKKNKAFPGKPAIILE